MKKHIAEDLPARQHPQASMSAGSGEKQREDKGPNDASGNEQKKIRQAVYDIRYRARREDIPLRQAYNEYIGNSGMSEMAKRTVRERLFGKEGGGESAAPTEKKEDYNIRDTATSAIASAMYKVFVEGIKDDILDEEYLEELKRGEAQKTAEGAKYKVEVHDKQTGKRYTRYANRDKISQLRARGLGVEMTEYGTPYEGERKKGEETAAALSKGKANGKRDDNFANNAPPYDKATHADRIAGARGKDQMGGKNVKESMGVISKEPNKNKIDVMKGSNKIKVNPEIEMPGKHNRRLMSNSHQIEGEIIIENSYDKFLMKVKGPKVTTEKACGKCGKTPCCCGKSEDMRDRYAKREVMKNKIRSMGVKNPIIMSSDDM